MTAPAEFPTQWQYGRWSPPETRMMADELPAHRFAAHTRTEKLLRKVRQYRATCTCLKWSHDEWRPTRAQARRDWQHHRNAAERQLALPV